MNFARPSRAAPVLSSLTTRVDSVGEPIVRPRHGVWALALLTATACTSSHGSDGPATPTRPAATRGAVQAHRAVPVSQPELDADLGETLAGRQRPTRANAELQYSGGAEGKALIVAVSCRGKGAVSVEVPALHASFPLTCGIDEPEVVYNQFALKAAGKPGTVAVTAPKAVTWAVTVGRGERVTAQ
jgi:hypothetical protein